MLDYRNSHKQPGKGRDYHAKFSANPYRSMIWEMERAVLDDVVQRHLSTPIRHLDFACGTGRVIEHFLPVAKESFGVDVSESMLAEARSRLEGRCTLVNADITRQKLFEDATFGLVTAFRFFPNAQDELRSEAMGTLAALLAPDGILIFNNHKNRTSLTYLVGRLVGRRDRSMSSEEVAKLVTEAGLEVLEAHHMGVVPATERYRLLPISLLRLAEKAASRVDFLRNLAFNQIIVCRRARSTVQGELA